MTKKITKILVLGMGTMGNGIAHAALNAGYDVNAFEIKKEFLDRGISTIRKNMEREVKKDKLTDDQLRGMMNRIEGYTDLDIATKDVDYVIEAVFEDIETKIDLYLKLNNLLDDDVIIASNTSTISISLLGGASGRADRFIGFHFFNPVPMMRLAELINGIETSEETTSITLEIAKKMGKEPIIAKDSPGFIVNRILLPMLNEAVFALQEGVGTVEDIDKGIKLGLGHPMGPFTLLDLIGIDTALHVSEAFYNAFQDSKYRIPYLMRQMVAAGRLGRKSGQGFYKY